MNNQWRVLAKAVMQKEDDFYTSYATDSVRLNAVLLLMAAICESFVLVSAWIWPIECHQHNSHIIVTLWSRPLDLKLWRNCVYKLGNVREMSGLCTESKSNFTDFVSRSVGWHHSWFHVREVLGSSLGPKSDHPNWNALGLPLNIGSVRQVRPRPFPHVSSLIMLQFGLSSLSAVVTSCDEQYNKQLWTRNAELVLASQCTYMYFRLCVALNCLAAVTISSCTKRSQDIRIAPFIGELVGTSKVY